MDIKLLDDGKGDPVVASSYITLAYRKSRRDGFRRAVYLCTATSLLFIAFGCFYAVYRQGVGLGDITLALPFDIRATLKLFAVISSPFLICFALAFTPFSNASAFAACALSGGAYGALMLPLFKSAVDSSVSYGIFTLIGTALCGILWCLTVAIFASVSYSYRTSLPKNGSGDFEDYFLSLMSSLLATLVICFLTLLVCRLTTIFM